MDELAALACGEGWTEERHAAFLDRVELSFVQQVLGGSDVRQASHRLGRRQAPQADGGRGLQVPAPAPLPLNRPLPDSAVESNRAGPAAARRREADGARRSVDPAAGW